MAINPEFQGGSVTDDPVVNEVIDIVCKRHMQGMSKFGKTMEENERPFDQWIGELVEELLDAVHYAIKAKKIIEKFKTKEKSLHWWCLRCEGGQGEVRKNSPSTTRANRCRP